MVYSTPNGCLLKHLRFPSWQPPQGLRELSIATVDKGLGQVFLASMQFLQCVQRVLGPRLLRRKGRGLLFPIFPTGLTVSVLAASGLVAHLIYEDVVGLDEMQTLGDSRFLDVASANPFNSWGSKDTLSMPIKTTAHKSELRLI